MGECVWWYGQILLFRAIHPEDIVSHVWPKPDWHCTRVSGEIGERIGWVPMDDTEEEGPQQVGIVLWLVRLRPPASAWSDGDDHRCDAAEQRQSRDRAESGSRSKV